MDKGQPIMTRLMRKYLELSAVCYRAATASHDERGRFRRGRVANRLHPAILKKIDLDEALDRVYQRFFGRQGTCEVSSISASNSLRHGSDTFSSVPDSSSGRPMTLG